MFRMKGSILLDAALFEVFRKRLVDVHIAVAVGVVRQGNYVGGITVIVLYDLFVQNALTKLRDPVGSPNDGVLKAEEEGAAGRFKSGKPVGDVHLHGYGYKGLVHGQEVPEVVEAGVLGHIDMFVRHSVFKLLIV